MNKKLFLVLVLVCLAIGALFYGLSAKHIHSEFIDKTLYEFKTAYVGENSKVVPIASMQEYPAKAKYKNIEIHSEQHPYELNIYLENTKHVSKENLFKNAAVTFALIDNLENLNYIDADSDQVIASYTRTEIDKILEDKGLNNTKGIGNSKESWESFNS